MENNRYKGIQTCLMLQRLMLKLTNRTNVTVQSTIFPRNGSSNRIESAPDWILSPGYPDEWKLLPWQSCISSKPADDT